MPASIAPTLYWSYWANLVYILGMFGYLLIDTISYLFVSFNETLSCLIYLFLTLVFVFDAILYTIDWFMYAVKSRENKDEPVQYRVEFVACVFQNLGSFFYFVGALFAFKRTRFTGETLLFYFLGVLAFLTESYLVFLGWRLSCRRKPSLDPKRGCVPQDVSLWAHAMNIIAATIYLCATSLAYRMYVHLGVANLNGVLILQMFGDLVYLFDAYMYYECWKRDKQENDANNERKKLVELTLVKHLNTENLPADENT